METHILGFPRIGAKRELKQALERHWRGEISQDQLVDVGRDLKKRHWAMQHKAGLSLVASGDFSFYDHVLDTTLMLGAVPERFGHEQAGLESYFRMARGDAQRNIPAMEMTKWFNTNYHYIVPELSPAQSLSLASRSIIEDTRLALECGHRPKPVLLGPITYLSLAKGVDGFDCWERLDDVLSVYGQVLGELGGLCEWIQIDEPVLCGDISAKARQAFRLAYPVLSRAARTARLLLATYFDTLDANLDMALSSGCAGLHVDLVHGQGQLDTILGRMPEGMILSAGVVDGRNVWKTDFKPALATLVKARERLGGERLMVGSSCSLLHSPVDLVHETSLDPELKSWMSFAVQKCAEIHELGEALEGRASAQAFEENARAVQSRRASPRAHSEAVRSRCSRVDQAMLRRMSPYQERKSAQSWLALPILPTTTIGSYPQTAEIRRQRRLFTAGETSREAYEAFLREEIRRVVEKQEELGLDVLVHGEVERNDMVEYFGQQLSWTDSASPTTAGCRATAAVASSHPSSTAT